MTNITKNANREISNVKENPERHPMNTENKNNLLTRVISQFMRVNF